MLERRDAEGRKRLDAAGETPLHTDSCSTGSAEGDAAGERAWRDEDARPLGPAFT